MHQLLIKLLLLLCMSSSALSANFALAIPLSNALQSFYSALTQFEVTGKVSLKSIEATQSVTRNDAHLLFTLIHCANKPINYYQDLKYLNESQFTFILQAKALLKQSIARRYDASEALFFSFNSHFRKPYLLRSIFFQPEKRHSLS